MKRKIWIRILLSCLAMIIFIGNTFLLVNASEEECHWYCIHAKDHQQPKADSNLMFVEDYDGYYIDHLHCDQKSDDKVIYLTFDAGYENGNVEKVLDTLSAEQVPGAFFILGHLISKNPDLINRMVSDGHTVCNHTFRHKNMCSFSDVEFLAELNSLEKAFYDLTGEEMAKYYRPPEGTFSKQNLICAKENGYKTIFWSFGYPDWDNQRQMSPERAKQIILGNIHNGEVMLLHPTSKTNADILGDVIKELKNQGYRFGTLDELTCGAKR